MFYLVEDSHFKVESLVNPGSCLGVLGVKLVICPVLIHQISSNGPGLVHHEVSVLQGGDGVLGVEGQDGWNL